MGVQVESVKCCPPTSLFFPDGKFDASRLKFDPPFSFQLVTELGNFPAHFDVTLPDLIDKTAFTGGNHPHACLWMTIEEKLQIPAPLTGFLLLHNRDDVSMDELRTRENFANPAATHCPNPFFGRSE
jgi:hypothetical protein